MLMRGLATSLALLLTSQPAVQAVTMPSNDNLGGPVTITPGSLQLSGQSESKERDRSSSGSSASYGDGDPALAVVAIVLLPALVVGGVVMAGVAVKDWMKATLAERRRRQAEEAELKRLEEEERRNVKAVGDYLTGLLPKLGEGILERGLQLQVDGAAEAAAAEISEKPGDKKAWQAGERDYKKHIDKAWEKFGPRLQPLFTRCHFTAILAQESMFGTAKKVTRAERAARKAVEDGRKPHLRGYIGPWQMGAAAWKDAKKDREERFGKSAVLDRYDPERSTYGAASYLAQCRERLAAKMKDMPDEEARKFVLSAYNRGPTAAKRTIVADVRRWHDAAGIGTADKARAFRDANYKDGKTLRELLATPLGADVSLNYDERMESADPAVRRKAVQEFITVLVEKIEYPDKILYWTRYCEAKP